MKNALLRKLARDERGLSTMEYAVLFVIIIVGALSLWSSLGQKLSTNLSKGVDQYGKAIDVKDQSNGNGSTP